MAIAAVAGGLESVKRGPGSRLFVGGYDENNRIRSLGVVACIAIDAIALLAQAPSNRRIVYFSSDRERTITVGRGGSGVVSFVTPVGTRMAVSYESTTEPNLMAKPFKMHGTVQIRLLRDSEIRGRLLAEGMLTAPVAIGGEEDVDLVVADSR